MPSRKASKSSLPPPLKDKTYFQTLLGSVIYLKSHRVVDKTVHIDCYVLRNGFDGPWRENNRVDITMPLGQEVEGTVSPFSGAVAIPPPPNASSLHP